MENCNYIKNVDMKNPGFDDRMYSNLFSTWSLELIRLDNSLGCELVASYLITAMMSCKNPEYLLNVFTEYVEDNVSVKNEDGKINHQFHRAMCFIRGNMLENFNSCFHAICNCDGWDDYVNCLHLVSEKGSQLI